MRFFLSCVFGEDKNLIMLMAHMKRLEYMIQIIGKNLWENRTKKWKAAKINDQLQTALVEG